MFISKKTGVFFFCGVFFMAPGMLCADTLSVASGAWVSEQVATKQSKDDTNVYKVGQNGAWVDASNAITVDTTYLKKTDNSTTGATEVAIDTTKVTTSGASGLSDSSTNLIQEKAVAEAIANNQVKPSSGVADGKVLTYTGTDANANVSAAYIKVPVATDAPSTVTPTGFAEIWVQ